MLLYYVKYAFKFRGVHGIPQLVSKLILHIGIVFGILYFRYVLFECVLFKSFLY